MERFEGKSNRIAQAILAIGAVASITAFLFQVNLYAGIAGVLATGYVAFKMISRIPKK